MRAIMLLWILFIVQKFSSVFKSVHLSKFQKLRIEKHCKISLGSTQVSILLMYKSMTLLLCVNTLAIII